MRSGHDPDEFAAAFDPDGIRVVECPVQRWNFGAFAGAANFRKPPTLGIRSACVERQLCRPGREPRTDCIVLTNLPRTSALHPQTETGAVWAC